MGKPPDISKRRTPFRHDEEMLFLPTPFEVQRSVRLLSGGRLLTDQRPKSGSLASTRKRKSQSRLLQIRLFRTTTNKCILNMAKWISPNKLFFDEEELNHLSQQADNYAECSLFSDTNASLTRAPTQSSTGFLKFPSSGDISSCFLDNKPTTTKTSCYLSSSSRIKSQFSADSVHVPEFIPRQQMAGNRACREGSDSATQTTNKHVFTLSSAVEQAGNPESTCQFGARRSSSFPAPSLQEIPLSDWNLHTKSNPDEADFCTAFREGTRFGTVEQSCFTGRCCFRERYERETSTLSQTRGTQLWRGRQVVGRSQGEDSFPDLPKEWWNRPLGKLRLHLEIV